jgi:DNA polymerase III psi subunit
MENISYLVLSPYQRAILNEMGISSWHLSSQKTQEKVGEQASKTTATSSQVISKDDALAKLKQLKVQTQTSVSTNSVLVNFSESDYKSQIFTDVLVALGLEHKQLIHISTNKLSHYSDYLLSWTKGEKISFNNKQLITPNLSELHHSDIKKQLWQHLQNVLSLKKI